MEEDCDYIELSGQGEKATIANGDKFILTRNGDPFPISPENLIAELMKRIQLPQYNSIADAQAAGLISGDWFRAGSQSQIGVPGMTVQIL